MDDLNLSGSYLWLPLLMQLLHIHRSPLLLSDDSDSRFMMSAALQDITHANWAIALCWRRWMIYIYICECKSVWVYSMCVCTLTGHQDRTQAAAASSPARGTRWCRRSSHQNMVGLHGSSVPIATRQTTTMGIKQELTQYSKLSSQFEERV